MTPGAVRVFGLTILATAWLSAALAQSGEPSLRQVKVIAVRSDSNSELDAACLPVLTDELRRTGRTIGEAADGADAEMVVRFERHDSQLGASMDPAEAYYSLRLWKNAPRKVVWTESGSAPLRGACKQIAKTISAHLRSAIKTDKPGIDLDTVPLTNSSTGDAALGAPAGDFDAGHPTSPVSDLTLPIQSAEPSPHPVKLMSLRSESSSELDVACLSALKEELRHDGRALGEIADGADAEMIVEFELDAAQQVRYFLHLWTTEPRKLIWTDVGGATEDGSGAACVQIGKDVAAHLRSFVAGKPIPRSDAITDLPVLEYRVEPRYPSELKKAGIEGSVVLQAVIDTKGNVQEVTVVKSTNDGFNKAAIAAVKARKYAPARKDGRPVAIYFTIRVFFHFPVEGS